MFLIEMGAAGKALLRLFCVCFVILPSLSLPSSPRGEQGRVFIWKPSLQTGRRASLQNKTALLLFNVNTSTVTRPNIYLPPLFIPLFCLPFTSQCHTPADAYHTLAVSIIGPNVRSPQCFGLCFNGWTCVCLCESESSRCVQVCTGV